MAQIEIKSELAGNVSKIEVKKGDRVSEGDVLAILESMKMEIPLTSTDDGVVNEIKIQEGDIIQEGDNAIILDI